MNYTPRVVTGEEIASAQKLMMGCLMSGLIVGELRQAVYDAYPANEESIRIMEDIFSGYLKLEELRKFWGDDNNET